MMAAALGELDKVRAPLMTEVMRLGRDPDYQRGQPPHRCCRRPDNQMRISPLEARAIARAFREEPELRRKLPAVIERLAAELPRLENSEERQSFDCPLLEGTRCLVHDSAKPIGCAAWHPPRPGQKGYPFTREGWKAFRERDLLNDRVCGPTWKLRVIPLWLRKVFAPELERHRHHRRPAGSERARGKARRQGSSHPTRP